MSVIKESLRLISLEIESKMKALGIWSVKRDDSHPQISTPSDWIQWDYLPSALAAVETESLPEAYGSIKIYEYLEREFTEKRFEQFRSLLRKWDETFEIYAAPINAKIPKLYERIVLEWVAPEASVNEAFDLKFEEIRSALKLPGYRTGQVPLEIIKQKYTLRVRDEIAGPFVLAQMKAGMIANGYNFDLHYPSEESDISLLRPDSPFPIRLTFSLPLPRSEEQIIEELKTLDLKHRQGRLDELLKMAEAGNMARAISAITLLKK